MEVVDQAATRVDREILDQNQEIKDAYEAGLIIRWYDALESLPVVGPLAAMGVDYARGNYNEGGLVAILMSIFLLK